MNSKDSGLARNGESNGELGTYESLSKGVPLLRRRILVNTASINFDVAAANGSLPNVLEPLETERY